MMREEMRTNHNSTPLRRGTQVASVLCVTVCASRTNRAPPNTLACAVEVATMLPSSKLATFRTAGDAPPDSGAAAQVLA